MYRSDISHGCVVMKLLFGLIRNRSFGKETGYGYISLLVRCLWRKKILGSETLYLSHSHHYFHTLELAFASIVTSQSLSSNPIIKGKLPKRFGVQAHDQSSRKSWIVSANPWFTVVEALLKTTNYGTTMYENLSMSLNPEFLYYTFANDQGTLVSLCCSSGCNCGYKRIYTAAGAVCSLFTLGQQVYGHS